MVLQRCPGGGAAYALCPGAAQQQQSILAYQMYRENIQDGSYSNVWGLKIQTTPYSTHLQKPNSHDIRHEYESGAWSTVANRDYNQDIHHFEDRVVTTGQRNTKKYGNPSSHENQFSHEHNRYGNGVEYYHIPSRMKYGYKKPFWRAKSLNDE